MSTKKLHYGTIVRVEVQAGIARLANAELMFHTQPSPQLFSMALLVAATMRRGRNETNIDAM